MERKRAVLEGNNDGDVVGAHRTGGGSSSSSRGGGSEGDDGVGVGVVGDRKVALAAEELAMVQREKERERDAAPPYSLR